MYKYLKAQKPKKKQAEPEEGAESDAEEEAFANEAIKKEMRRLQSGAGHLESDDEEVDVDYSESEDEAGKEKQEGDDDDDDFFGDQDDLEDVNLDDEDDDEIEGYGQEDGSDEE